MRAGLTHLARRALGLLGPWTAACASRTFYKYSKDGVGRGERADIAGIVVR